MRQRGSRVSGTRLRSLLAAACAAVFGAGPGLAADFPATPTSYTVAPLGSTVTAPTTPGPFGIISEVRGGLFYHGYDGPEAGLVDVNLELLTPRPALPGGYWNYLIPRLALGGNINTGGRTSDGYLTLVFQTPEFYHFFGEITAGGSINDGHTQNVPPPQYAKVGCHLMFRESVSIGYHLSAHWEIMATAEHISNDRFCYQNAGITNFGARLGYIF